MDSYDIQWKRSAEKDLLGIDNFYRIRVGDYRVIYQVDTNKDFLTIYYVRHRREAYRKRK
ncbi:type II toxin-antitoxin system RelE/ParE family toxin [bacterium]|nr:type II toxin-antitoxin system RelE/ParE family toxin [bacterium]